MSHIDEGRIAAYLDGELPAGSGELVEIELHVEACAECRKLLEEALKHRNRARSILRSGTPSVTDAPPFEEILRRAGKSGSSRGMARERSRLASLAWAATIVLAIGAGWYVTRDRMNGPLASILRRSNATPRAQPETAVVLAERNEAETPAETREQPVPSAAPTLPTPAPVPPTLAAEAQPGARADQAATAVAGAPANRAPAIAALDEKAKFRDTTPAAKLAAPPVIAGQTLANAAPAKSAARDSVADALAKKDLALDAGSASGQPAAEQKKAESLAAARNGPVAQRGRTALAPSAATPAPALPTPPPPWRETSQGGAMRQLGRLPLQVPELPVLAYYVRPSGAPEIRVTHDLGQGQVLELIQTRVTQDSVVPEARNETASFAGSEVSEEAEGYRTTVRGPLSRDSLSALLRKLR